MSKYCNLKKAKINTLCPRLRCLTLTHTYTHFHPSLMFVETVQALPKAWDVTKLTNIIGWQKFCQSQTVAYHVRGELK